MRAATFHRGLARAAAAIAVAWVAGCASTAPTPAVERYEAVLSGAQEVPAVATRALGRAELQFDQRTNLLQWQVSYEGLSGRLTAAHLHGPAGPGQNAPPVIPLDPTASPLRGQLRLTPEQFTQLSSGQWYVNLHTAVHPAGEIRGQVRHRPD